MNRDLGVWTSEECALVLIDYQKEMFPPRVDDFVDHWRRDEPHLSANLGDRPT